MLWCVVYLLITLSCTHMHMLIPYALCAPVLSVDGGDEDIIDMYNAVCDVRSVGQWK